MKEYYFILITYLSFSKVIPRDFRMIIETIQDQILELNNSKKEYLITDLSIDFDECEGKDYPHEKYYTNRIDYYYEGKKIASVFLLKFCEG